MGTLEIECRKINAKYLRIFMLLILIPYLPMDIINEILSLIMSLRVICIQDAIVHKITYRGVQINNFSVLSERSITVPQGQYNYLRIYGNTCVIADAKYDHIRIECKFDEQLILHEIVNNNYFIIGNIINLR